MRTCSVDDCEAQHYGLGLCSRHYKRLRRHGDPLGGASERKRHDSSETCSVDGCDGERTRRTWCGKHYLRWHRYGDPNHPPQSRVRRPSLNPKVCGVEQCNRRMAAHGWCQMHLRRWRRNGDPLLRQRAAPGEIANCSAEGCNRVSQARGLCKTHYTTWVRSQDDYVPRKYVKRLAILDRDGWICHLCGDRIPSDARWPNLLSASVDHVIPLARGGADDDTNLAAAHLGCNISKGDRIVTSRRDLAS